MNSFHHYFHTSVVPLTKQERFQTQSPHLVRFSWNQWHLLDMSHLKDKSLAYWRVSGACERHEGGKGKGRSVASPHSHPYSLDSCQGNIPDELGLWWRTWRLGALVAAARSVGIPAGILVPAAVVHVEQQGYNIDDVHVKKHHDDHEVWAGANAALVTGQTLAGGPERQGRTPGRRRILTISRFLLVSHFDEIQGVDASSLPIWLFIWEDKHAAQRQQMCWVTDVHPNYK